jgi:hypothetical protein
MMGAFKRVSTPETICWPGGKSVAKDKQLSFTYAPLNMSSGRMSSLGLTASPTLELWHTYPFIILRPHLHPSKGTVSDPLLPDH